MTRIPITMCHGITPATRRGKPMTVERLELLSGIAEELGFESITYDDLAAWRAGSAVLPERPIMWDIDHPVKSVRRQVYDVLSRRGFKANLFVNTGFIEECPPEKKDEMMTWAEVGELAAAGWQIGAHTHTHPNLSQLSKEDPSGEKIRLELERCDELIREHVGITPKDFAFTGTSFSSQADREVAKRYRFGRLWIIGTEYGVDGQIVRYADLVGVTGPDEPDGGPPQAARYITKETPPYRLPSMELTALIYEPEAFRKYLDGAPA